MTAAPKHKTPISKALLPDALIVAGAAGIAYGVWLVYEPAGFIVAGVLLIVGGVLAARSAT